MYPWILAARPKTLVAGLVPVLIGSAYSFHIGAFTWGVFWAALLGALAIQVGANYVNDAADFQKGADTQERLGPPRMAALGILSPRALYVGASIAFFFAAVFGLYLVYFSGWEILWIGIFSILFAILYTVGPFPLAYLGLGDVFVLIFFGIIAVCGTEFAHTQHLSYEGFLLSLMVGVHSVSLIAVNNLRDIPTDIKVGKKTLAVRLGDRASRIYYSATVILPFILWLFLGVRLGGLSYLLPFLALPLAVANIVAVFMIEDRKVFNALLGKTAAMQLLFSLFLAIGLVISS